MMGVRLVEMKRVLKDTGSIYLHCDPTASHYLKLLIAAHGSRSISVHAPDGAPVSRIEVEDERVTNCCFGGDDFQTLYITLSGVGRVVTVRWERPGLRPNGLQ